MPLHLVHVGIISFAAVVMQNYDPVELVPVEGGVADRGSLSGSLRVLPADLRQNQLFEKLYKIVGSDDVYIRQSGGLRAVFRNPVYVDTELGSIPIVPAGTVYCIGEVTPHVLRQLGILVTPGIQIQEPEDNSTSTPSRPVRITATYAPRNTIKFLDDEKYRRQRLALFVLDFVLSN